MPRPCSICAGTSRALPEENLPKLNECLRARERTGESIAAIAREFNVSEDALSRHALNHVDRRTRRRLGDDDVRERLLLMQTRCDELYERAIAVDDIGGATDVMTKLTMITDNLGRLQRESSSSGFRRMSIEDKIADILKDGKIPTELLDAISRIVGDCDSVSELAQPLHKPN
jgi:hypothetical protein